MSPLGKGGEIQLNGKSRKFAHNSRSTFDAVIDAVIHQIRIYPLRIPLRTKVTHAAAEREFSDSVVVAIELINGTTGCGETLPRPYVTGETTESAVRDMREIFAPALLKFHARSFAEALEFIESLPWNSLGGRSIPAARAAIELALLDASMRAFHRDIDAVVQWMGLPGFGSPGNLPRVRFSGVLACEDDRGTMRRLRLMYWGGLRHFKLKVGFPGDYERLDRVARYLRRALAKGRATLRADANAAWSAQDAATWLESTEHFPIAAIEQPVKRGDEEELRLAVRAMIASRATASPGAISGSGATGGLSASAPRRATEPTSSEVEMAAGRVANRDPSPLIIYDESVLTIEDAKRLIDLGGNIGFNIRISKCGGLLPSLRIAALARKHGVTIQLGCMVGETSILSAAGLRFLEVCPGVKWAEGCFGRFLLGGDVVAKSLRFGSGGRPPSLRCRGLVPPVIRDELRDYCESEPIVMQL